MTHSIVKPIKEIRCVDMFRWFNNSVPHAAVWSRATCSRPWHNGSQCQSSLLIHTLYF